MLAAFAGTGILLIALAGPAHAYTTARGFVAQDYATGFPESTANDWGPIGIAFDQSDNLYVADTADGNIYRFQPGGGVASAATRLTSSPIAGQITGLAISSRGAMYLARYKAGDVVQIDPGTGEVLRTIARVRCATGLAIDPATGDLFVSDNQCGSTIWRVSGLGSADPTVSAFAKAPGVDGLAFDQDGTLYAESDGTVVQIAGTQSATPGLVTDIARVPEADGLAFGAHATGQPPFLVVNRNNGVVTRLDFGHDPPSQTDIFSGGSRGDFATVDSQGCLYTTQSASVVRISSPGGGCAFEPTTRGPLPAPGIAMTTLTTVASGGACRQARSVKLRVRQQGRVRLKSAVIYVNGRRVKTLHGSAVTAPFVLGHLPTRPFTVKIIAVTARGRRMVTRRSFAGCAGAAGPSCTRASRLRLSVPQQAGTSAVRVDAYLNGRRLDTVRGRRLTSIVLGALPHGRFTVRLAAAYADGRHRTTRRTFVRC